MLIRSGDLVTDMGVKEFIAEDINEANLIIWEWETKVIPDAKLFFDSDKNNAIIFEWEEAFHLQTMVPEGYNGRSRVIGVPHDV